MSSIDRAITEMDAFSEAAVMGLRSGAVQRFFTEDEVKTQDNDRIRAMTKFGERAASSRNSISRLGELARKTAKDAGLKGRDLAPIWEAATGRALPESAGSLAATGSEASGETASNGDGGEASKTRRSRRSR